MPSISQHSRGSLVWGFGSTERSSALTAAAIVVPNTIIAKVQPLPNMFTNAAAVKALERSVLPKPQTSEPRLC